ncbi:endonuclease/exonuclease/phosphatase family protein [Chengkuizengella axinellae]|uniref:Endonuclease/exonuclease/phosphatase family protein n=1 Tax=Chengkuizengella axinellae TaxID=3064388 RepID=A0ABT9IXI8_9BACL|nr:endonuclease/exonuclease/phosphatase family protein [Chengkuizengella sp. 2205SS18-9]MDP5274072.1 endonuclease/exonuclease/phosphatase family protein [Chengkuizengella sp. 2205SS18-9]
MGIYKKLPLTFLTWNIYFGADLTPLINTTPQEVPKVTTEVFNQFEQTDFQERATSIAQQIKVANPQLIGLQEVAIWTVRSIVKRIETNFLTILIKELNRLGLDYSVVAMNHNFSSELPSSTGDLIGIQDRDVILAKRNAGFCFCNIQEHNYSKNLSVLVGGAPFTILRGWSSVDIIFEGQTFRLINTHLEGNSMEVRLNQAKELLDGPVKTSLPLILLGDFNSDADGPLKPTYDLFISAGFRDVWNIAGSGKGFTAFQARNLLNTISSLNERIDLILFKGNFKVLIANILGDQQVNRTPSGLWPSDHAGVVSSLRDCP